MKKKNYGCKGCGKKYNHINIFAFNYRCIKCKKNNKKNKALKCFCYFRGGDKFGPYPHKGRIIAQRTMYVETDRNYTIACKNEEIETKKYWDEMWADYYSAIT